MRERISFEGSRSPSSTALPASKYSTTARKSLASAYWAKMFLTASPAMRPIKTSSWPSSSAIVSSSFPRELAGVCPRSAMRGTTHVSPLKSARRSAFETTFSRLAIDMRTDTPEDWFT